MQFIIIILFVSLFINNTICQNEKIYGIHPDHLEQHYVELLLNDKLSFFERELLSRRISAVHYHQLIMNKLSLLDQQQPNGQKQNAKKNRKSAKKSLEMSKSYQFIKQSIEIENSQDVMRLEYLCHMWHFELLLYSVDTNDDNNNNNTILLLKKDCKEAIKIEHNEKEMLEEWMHDFLLNMSRKHLEFLMKILVKDQLKVVTQFWHWFDLRQPMPDESVLSFRLRNLNVIERLDQLSEVKRIAVQHLFPHQLGTFEMVLPIHMAIDVGNVVTMKKIFKGIFGIGMTNMPSNAFIRWLEVLILYGQIWSYFEQNRDNVDERPFLEISWRNLLSFLLKLPQYVNDEIKEQSEKAIQPNMSDILRNLLKSLQARFGQLSETAQLRPQKLLDNYRRWFVELFEQDQQFHDACQSENSAAILLWLNSTINFGKGMGQQPRNGGVDQFLDKLNIVNEIAVADDESRQNRVDISPVPFLTHVSSKVVYDQCPHKDLTFEQLSEMDSEEETKDPVGFFVALCYLKLLHAAQSPAWLTEDATNAQSFHALELSAALWYYNEHLRNLFEFGEALLLDANNEKFANFLMEHKERWQMVKAVKNIRQTQQLCLLYKMAYYLVYGSTLDNENVKWERHVNKLVIVVEPNDCLQMRETLIVPSADEILSDENDCINTEKADKMFQKLRNTTVWMQTIHFFCLRRWTKRLKQIQSFFCYGSTNLCIHPTCTDNVMNRLMWIIGTNVVDKLKMAMPEIMHYEIMHQGIYCSCFIEQLSYKTDSILAQSYEARIITPQLLQRINDFERRMKNGKCKFAHSSNVCGKFLRIIMEGKSQIYAQLSTCNSKTMRLALCQLWHLNNFLAENETKLAKSIGTQKNDSEKMLPKLDLSSACNSEKQIKMAFLEAREKVQLFGVVKTLLTSDHHLRSVIREQPGTYARLKNYLVNILSVPKSEVFNFLKPLNLLNPAIFNNDQLFFTNSINAQFSGADLALSISASLRTNLTVFVRWMDAKIEDAIKQNETAILAKRLAKAWEEEARRFFENLYGQTYDFEDAEKTKNLCFEAVSALQASKDFMEKVMDERRRKNLILKSKKMKPISMLGIEWIKCHEKAMNFEGVRHDLSKSRIEFVQTNWHQFIDWLFNIRQDQFIKLITENDQFSAELKKEIEASPAECVEDIVKFVDDEQKQEELFNFLGLRELFLLKKKKEEENKKTEEKQAKKQKAKKKKTKSANSNAIQTPVLAGKNEDNLAPFVVVDEKEEESLESYKTAFFEQQGQNGDGENKKIEEFSEKLENNLENFDKISDKKPPAKLLTLGDFANDEILTRIYIEFIVRVLTLRQNGKYDDDQWVTNGLKIEDKLSTNDQEMLTNLCDDNQDTKKKLLNVAAFSNEIAHRLQAVKELLNNDFEIIRKIEKKELDQSWHKLKSQQITRDTTNLEEMEKNLHNLLKKILKAMERKTAISEVSLTLNEMAKLLHFQKFARAIVSNGTFWTRLNEQQKKEIFFALFDGEEIHGTKFDAFLAMSRKMEFQKKIDKNLYAQFKKASLNENENEENNSIFSHHFSDGWQQLEIDEEKERQQLELTNKMLNSDEISAIVGISNETLENAIVNLRQIFQNWNLDAMFKISFRHLLSFQDDKIESICLFPNGFELANLFGQEICDMKKRELCKSNSIYCHFCQNANVTFLQKFWADFVSAVPMIKLTFFGISIEIRIVIVPIISRLPPGPINVQKIDTFLRILAQSLDKKVRADHLHDEGVYKSAQNWHADEIEKLKNKLSKSAYGNERIKINEQINALMAQRNILFTNREKVIRERQKIKILEGMLHVLAVNEKNTNFWSGIQNGSKLMPDFRDQRQKLILTDFGIYQKTLAMLLNGADDQKMSEFKFTDKFGTTITELNKFRLISAYLHKWAKGKFIFGDELGYFGTKPLIIMLTKIFVLFPNASMSFLVEKFFLTFSAWHWPMPVQLAEIEHGRRGDHLCWTPGREWVQKRQQNLSVQENEIMPMPIIAPTFPAQNTAKNVNLSSSKVLKNELRKAFDQIRKDVNGLVEPLEKKKFVEKYDHFIVVLCEAVSVHDIENFCNFVGKNLRYELLELVERPLEEWVKLCHLLPRWITVADSGAQKSDQNGNAERRLWLIGIELNTPQKGLSKFKNKLKSILKKKFGQQIKKNFRLENGVELQADYVDERPKLAQW